MSLSYSEENNRSFSSLLWPYWCRKFGEVPGAAEREEEGKDLLCYCCFCGVKMMVLGGKPEPGSL